MTPLMWAIALLAIAMGIVVLEMFVPSGGVLAICAATSAIASVVIVFKYEGVFFGSLFFAASCLLLGITLTGVVKWWPQTSIGRQVLNLPPGEEREAAATQHYDGPKLLIGQRGISVSKMMPGGVITLGGKPYDAISQAGAIEEGTPVRIISVDGTRIVVRKDNRVVVAEETPVPKQTSDDSEVSSDSEENDTRNEQGDGNEPHVIPNPFEDPLV